MRVLDCTLSVVLLALQCAQKIKLQGGEFVAFACPTGLNRSGLFLDHIFLNGVWSPAPLRLPYRLTLD